MSKFSEYVRSSSFRLDLSDRQIKVLLALSKLGPEDERLNLHPYHALERRGLLTWSGGKGCRLTKAGELVAELLVEAGYAADTGSVENVKAG